MTVLPSSDILCPELGHRMSDNHDLAASLLKQHIVALVWTLLSEIKNLISRSA